MTKIDLCQLQKEIRSLKRGQKLYRLLKGELSKLGFWKNRIRGNPKKAYALGWGKHKRKP